MKILVIGPKWVAGWTESVAAACEQCGHEVGLHHYKNEAIGAASYRVIARIPRRLQFAFRIAANVGKRARNRTSEARLHSAVKRARVDVVLVLKGETLSQECLRGIRRHCRCIIGWWLDDPNRYPSVIAALPIYDRFYVFDKVGAEVATRTSGSRVVSYLPCAFDPAIFRPLSISDFDRERLQCDVALVGSYEPRRDLLLGALQGLKVGLWGDGWERSAAINKFPAGTWRARGIQPTDVAKIYNLAKVCPNVHHPQTREGGLNMRAFEISGAGGFQVCDLVPGIESLFRVGCEIAVYRSWDECRAIIDEALRVSPDVRRRQATAAHLRAMHDHTYRARVQTMLAEAWNTIKALGGSRAIEND